MRVSLAKRIESIKGVAKMKADKALVQEHMQPDFTRCARLALKQLNEEQVINLIQNLTLLVYVNEKRHSKVYQEMNQILALRGP